MILLLQIKSGAFQHSGSFLTYQKVMGISWHGYCLSGYNAYAKACMVDRENKERKTSVFLSTNRCVQMILGREGGHKEAKNFVFPYLLKMLQVRQKQYSEDVQLHVQEFLTHFIWQLSTLKRSRLLGHALSNDYISLYFYFSLQRLSALILCVFKYFPVFPTTNVGCGAKCGGEER